MLGDVDGDGFDDLLVALRSGSSGMEEGRVVRGSRMGLVNSGGWVVPVGGSPIGDINGDGYADMASVFQDQAHGTALQILCGSSLGPTLLKNWSVHSEQSGSMFGNEVAGAGDVNGDGYEDMLVSAPGFSGRLRRSGKAYLYLGSPQGPGGRPDWTAEYPLPVRKDVDEAYEQFFGQGLAMAGDVNGDGFDDVIVGAAFAENGDLNEGLAFVYHGSRQGPSPSPDWRAESNHAHSLFGQSVCRAGDINGDGVDDLVVGLPEATDGEMREGAAVVYHGSRSGLASRPAWLMESDHSNEEFGRVVSGAGDLNGDGFADVLVLGPNYRVAVNGASAKAGRLVVAYGGPKGLRFSNSWSLEKPFLTALQQSLERYGQRYGSVVYWGPWMVALAAVSTGFMIVQARLRRLLRQEIEKNRLLIIEQERTRLARDLHDELGGHLARLSEPAEGSGECIAEAARGVTTGIERIIWSLHPGHRSLSDLACGLTDLAENVLRDTSIRRRFDIPLQLPPIEMSAETLDAIYRAAQEALNNVRKHSQATRVTLGMALRGDRLEVRIADDGLGLPEGAAVARAGLGLAGMAARLREVGGTWAAEPNDPRGLVIRLAVPCRS
jgi:signal transduction histidine kinase